MFLPASLALLWFYGVGLLGFIPLLTCYAYLGNMYVATRYAHEVASKRTVRLLFLAGIVLSGAIPALVYVIAGSLIESVLSRLPWPSAWPLP